MDPSRESDREVLAALRSAQRLLLEALDGAIAWPLLHEMLEAASDSVSDARYCVKGVSRPKFPLETSLGPPPDEVMRPTERWLPGLDPDEQLSLLEYLGSLVDSCRQLVGEALGPAIGRSDWLKSLVTVLEMLDACRAEFEVLNEAADDFERSYSDD